jgi:hypothetical protein
MVKIVPARFGAVRWASQSCLRGKIPESPPNGLAYQRSTLFGHREGGRGVRTEKRVPPTSVLDGDLERRSEYRQQDLPNLL